MTSVFCSRQHRTKSKSFVAYFTDGIFAERVRSAAQTSLLFLFQVVLFVLSGCAISNEGATDYRVLKPDAKHLEKFTDPSQVSLGAIDTGNGIVVSLKQAFVKEFIETASPIRWWPWGSGQPNGEVAIVVNAFEQGPDNKLDFGPNGVSNARVVYFSDDVSEGQFLNLANLNTIYGPLRYGGKPFTLDIYIIEMDTPGPQLRQLLANLAQIGSTAYPPAHPLAGPLAQLAGTLITDDQDDRVYHFSLVLRPIEGATSGVHFGTLEPGDYLFIREEDRLKDTKWGNLRLDKKLGRLIDTSKPGCSTINESANDPSTCFYRDMTYIVVEINTAAGPLEQEMQQIVYSELQNALVTKLPPIFREPSPTAAIKAIADDLARKVVAEALLSHLDVLDGNTANEWNKQVAAERFVSLWFETGQSTEGEKPSEDIGLAADDKQTVEGRVSKLLVKCGISGPELLDFMGYVQNRTATPEKKAEVMDKLVCRRES